MREPDAAPAPGRNALQRRYLQLVREQLPAAAARGGWVLRRDHCFGRVLLDAVVGGCWYDALDRRTAAYRQLDDHRLTEAVELAERLLVEGDPLLRRLDAQSLAWRGKEPKPAPIREDASRDVAIMEDASPEDVSPEDVSRVGRAPTAGW